MVDPFDFFDYDPYTYNYPIMKPKSIVKQKPVRTYQPRYETLHNSPRTASSRAVTPTTTVALPFDHIRECFKTTGIITSKQLCLKVTGIILDTGASANYISREAVCASQLTVYRCEPQPLSTANGIVWRTKFVHFALYISGIKKTLTAFVGEDIGNSLILGIPAIDSFDMRNNPNFGRHKETRWSIAQPDSRKRLVLRADPNGALARLTKYDLVTGLRIAQQLGETTDQRNSADVLQRARERFNKLKRKHNQRAHPGFIG